MKNRIILARHGEDEDNANGILNGRRDMPLTIKGISQAYGLLKNIKKYGLDIGLVLSSKLRRAHKTAGICADGLGVQHVALDYLIERNHGVLEGHPYSDIPVMAKKYCERFGFTYVLEVDGGETYPELLQRAGDVLSKLKNLIEVMNVDGDVLVVSHGAISRAMLVAHRGLAWQDLVETPSFGNCEFKILD